MDAINISEGTVGSRFVTQDEIESARARKDEQWKAAYARHARIDCHLELELISRRLGQEPPQLQQTDETYDGRSLAEVGPPIPTLFIVLLTLPTILETL
jgi:hypothetical protein